ncbi:ATP-synt Eps domain containing protein [Trichuris trichiura]|uniref:ATP-synt Eps domain containing protein n=1 Tax=Trichuris trichiura TaxID=36087 RepID=A0A077YY86_TRITR|nr:ATP-synt Eps domain containing protein [Trichuris trichiura]
MTLFYWRMAGVNYIRYSEIAGKIVRSCLKEPLRSEALKREGTTVKFARWKDGKQVAKAE